MRIGVPKETAPGERRVALVPESVQEADAGGLRDRRRGRRRRRRRLSRRGLPRGRRRRSSPIRAALLGAADLVLKVGPPSVDGGRDEVALDAAGRRSISAR